jgi:hypothetical protein
MFFAVVVLSMSKQGVSFCECFSRISNSSSFNRVCYILCEIHCAYMRVSTAKSL